MNQHDLFPRAQRHVRQPRKDVLRDQLALASAEIERLRIVIVLLCPSYPSAPWWRSLYPMYSGELSDEGFVGTHNLTAERHGKVSGQPVRQSP